MVRPGELSSHHLPTCIIPDNPSEGFGLSINTAQPAGAPALEALGWRPVEE
jgi:hypothetical protein